MATRTFAPLAVLTIALLAGARPAQSQRPAPSVTRLSVDPNAAQRQSGPGGASGHFLIAQLPTSAQIAPPVSLAQQSQGGFAPRSQSGILAPGGYTQIAANCIDLFYSTPDHKTRYAAAPDAGAVQLADGAMLSLQDAIQRGLVTLSGRHPSDRSPQHPVLLQFVLSNTSTTPLSISVRAGAAFAPAGRAAGSVSQLEGLLRVRGVERWFGSNLMAYAVWAARGSTRDDVEQTLMTALPEKEVAQVQQVLRDAGIREVFNRDTEEYQRLHGSYASRMEGAKAVRGHTLLGGRTPATVEAVKGNDGRGLVVIHPTKRPGVFYYSALFKAGTRGRLDATLHHLNSGFPVEANGGRITIDPGAKSG